MSRKVFSLLCRDEMRRITLMKTIKLSESLRPTFDYHTHGDYKGNHYDLSITWKRDGDNVTETIAYTRNASGGFTNRKEHTFSVSTLVGDCLEMGFIAIDDIPQGLTIVK